MMNKKSVLSVIYGIAVFAAFISAVALLYGAIELLRNTSFYGYTYDEGYINNNYYEGKIFHEFQVPLGSFLLVTAIVAGVGSVCSILTITCEKDKVKKVSFCTVCAVVLVAVVFLVAGVCVWNTYYHGSFDGSDTYPSSPALITSGSAAGFAIYSAYMTSMVQLLAIFVVIVAVLVCLAVMSRKQGRAIASDTDVGQDAQDTVE